MTSKKPDDHLLKPLAVTSSNEKVTAEGAANGVFSRRQFMAGLAGSAAATLSSATVADGLDSWRTPGSGFSNYGVTQRDESSAIRWISEGRANAFDGVSWTPLHSLEGSITPNGLHFERHHNGVPTIDPTSWEMSVHGLVDRALGFNLETLYRYPQHTRIAFIECGGNSNSLWHPTPMQAPAGYVHGLVSCAEWTGVRLSLLLSEAGIKPDGRWIVIDGLDSAGVSVSLPLDALPEDTMIALYQNGEPVRPENGFPARLLVPGWEGIVNVKWLRSLQVTDRPAMTKFDTVSYTDLLKDGLADRFSFEMGVKSVITSPSPGQELEDQGFYEISGLAWSGAGAISRVEVSADGGNSWTDAVLQAPVLDRALTRFRLPWKWSGEPALLQSRATDLAARVQPTRAQLLEDKGTNVYHHYNAIVTASVETDGRIYHVYA